MPALTNAHVREKLEQQFPTEITSYSEPYNLLTAVCDKAAIIPVLKWLHDHPELPFTFLTDLCGVNFPDDKDRELVVVYQLHALTVNLRLRLKCFLPAHRPEIDTATKVFSAADWMERETYDFFGIRFRGHPNLKRILNVDDMNYFPLLKKYPLEDATRTDKQDKYFGR